MLSEKLQVASQTLPPERLGSFFGSLRFDSNTQMDENEMAFLVVGLEGFWYVLMRWFFVVARHHLIYTHLPLVKIPRVWRTQNRSLLTTTWNNLFEMVKLNKIVSLKIWTDSSDLLAVLSICLLWHQTWPCLVDHFVEIQVMLQQKPKGFLDQLTFASQAIKPGLTYTDILFTGVEVTSSAQIQEFCWFKSRPFCVRQLYMMTPKLCCHNFFWVTLI